MTLPFSPMTSPPLAFYYMSNKAHDVNLVGADGGTSGLRPGGHRFDSSLLFDPIMFVSPPKRCTTGGAE